jgi:hypothetical protein
LRAWLIWRHSGLVLNLQTRTAPFSQFADAEPVSRARQWAFLIREAWQDPSSGIFGLLDLEAVRNGMKSALYGLKFHSG